MRRPRARCRVRIAVVGVQLVGEVPERSLIVHAAVVEIEHVLSQVQFMADEKLPEARKARRTIRVTVHNQNLLRHIVLRPPRHYALAGGSAVCRGTGSPSSGTMSNSTWNVPWKPVPPTSNIQPAGTTVVVPGGRLSAMKLSLFSR